MFTSGGVGVFRYDQCIGSYLREVCSITWLDLHEPRHPLHRLYAEHLLPPWTLPLEFFKQLRCNVSNLGLPYPHQRRSGQDYEGL
jgi:hypothetical protein